ncbi:EamA family transporter [Nocardioides sp.]|uniref:EamA family transporter n=1 Tax=Nocardioides sp. TaxID=35761 RepID=UPI003D0D2137
MGIVLSLLAAIAYGLSDFIGGLASRRTSPWPVALLADLGALLGALVLAVAITGQPTQSDLLWGSLAGAGGGIGGAFLYRGMSTGRMGVVGPVSAVGSAVVPVVAGLVGGERPMPVVWLGIAVAFPGIWMVSREPGDSAGLADGLVDGVLAGLGFGVLFAAMGQVPEGAGYWPLVAAQVLGLVAIVGVATALRVRWVPRARSELWGLPAGVLATVAVFAFLLATQTGLLTASAVITSLYPAVTILLAAVILNERVHRAQSLGLALCAGAVVLVALG